MLARTLFSLLPLLASFALAAPTKRQDGVTVVNNCYNSGQVALTFDDGPWTHDYDIANALNSVGGKATFFLNGQNYGCIYERAQQIRDLSDQGHTFGSHTWSHADLTTLDEAGINKELEKVETAFINILGLKPLYFRPPYGSYNDLVIKVLGERGYKKMFIWNAVTGDSVGDDLNAQERVLDDVASQYPSPALVLQHSTIDSAIDATYYGVDKLQQAGYQMVSVDTCLGSSGEWPYEYVQERGPIDGSWTC